MHVHQYHLHCLLFSKPSMTLKVVIFNFFIKRKPIMPDNWLKLSSNFILKKSGDKLLKELNYPLYIEI